MNLLFPTFKSTGQQKEVFWELKIKVLVDLAGHLHQLLLVNYGLCYKRKQSIYHNSNWFTVQVHTEMMVVMVDRDSQLWNTLRIMESPLKPLILSKEYQNYVKSKVDNWKLQQSQKKVVVQAFKTLFQVDRLLLQLMPEDGLIMHQEFLAIVLRTLIMLFYWSVS